MSEKKQALFFAKFLVTHKIAGKVWKRLAVGFYFERQNIDFTCLKIKFCIDGHSIIFFAQFAYITDALWHLFLPF